MKYDKKDRQAIGSLSVSARRMFDVLEKNEQGEFLAAEELCSALNVGCQFVSFSCLLGVGSEQRLGTDLGGLFLGRIKKTFVSLIEELKVLGYQNGLKVILDDYEPHRVWQWSITQEEVTLWYQMVIEENKDQIPEGWQIQLWSEIENKSGVCYEQMLEMVGGQDYALLVHQQLEHMKKFPNKKLLGNVRDAVLRRIAEYSLQGKVLEELFPNAILMQTETPWRVKDALYSPSRRVSLPIIHPYPEERR